MKIQHLKAFTAIVKHGGVIRAAEQLHVTQPALSASLKALEADLGCTLFDRSRGNRRIRLTASGQRFHARALAILHECEVARAELRGEERPTERLRLGVLDTLPKEWVKIFLANLREDSRSARQAIEIWEGSAERLAGWFGQERLDAALTAVAEKGADTRVLWREPFVAVVSPAHAFAGRARRAIAIRELAGEPFVFRSNCELSPVGEAQLRASGITLRTVVRAEREELAFDSVEQGYGVTLAPRSIVPARLVALNVSGFSLARTIGLHWRPGLDRAHIDRVYNAATVARKALPSERSGKIASSRASRAGLSSRPGTAPRARPGSAR